MTLADRALRHHHRVPGPLRVRLGDELDREPGRAARGPEHAGQAGGEREREVPETGGTVAHHGLSHGSPHLLQHITRAGEEEADGFGHRGARASKVPTRREAHLSLPPRRRPRPALSS